jgi:hypothetical protein
MLADRPVLLVGIHGMVNKFALLGTVMPEIIDGDNNIITAALARQYGFQAGSRSFLRFYEYKSM